MALNTKVGSFAKPTGAGAQTITGVGFQPKVIVFWLGAGVSTGVSRPHTFSGIGFTTGPTNSYAISTSSRDAVATSSSGRRMAPKAISQSDFNGGLHEADLTSFDADGFTLAWGTDNSGVSMEINYLALGGSDIESAKVVRTVLGGSTGNVSITGAGFSPDLVLLAGSGISDTGQSVTTTHDQLSFGALNRAGEQWSNGKHAINAGSPTNSTRMQRVDSCLTYVTSTDTNNYRANFVSMDADGYTMNAVVNTVGATHVIFSLCLKGVFKSKIGSFVKSTAAAPTTQAITGIGFKPKALLISDVHNTATLTPSIWANWNLGGADGFSQRGSSIRDQDAVNPSNADSIFFSDAISAQQDSASVVTKMSLNSLDSSGFTVGLSPNSANPLEHLYLAMASLSETPYVPMIML